MPKPKPTVKKRPIESYEHKDKQRVNNPPVGLVTPDTDPDAGSKKTYAYDPHLDPQLQWAGKAEHTSFEIPTVSLHVHERIDPRTIIDAVRKRNGSNSTNQMPLFGTPDENPPLREAVEFYKHAHGWSNRLVAGDSLLVMNSLLEKEGLAGKVQMIYIDPPYGIKYGSNFQPFVNKRDVKDGRDEDLTAEPEQIRAFRDTWELGIHSYLTYLRDRLLLARELLTESGSMFVQINAENAPLVRILLDEVFGVQNFVADIIFRKKSLPLGGKFIETMNDHLLFYSRDRDHLIYRHLYQYMDEVTPHWRFAEFPDGEVIKISMDEFRSPKHPVGTRYFRLFSLIAPSYSANSDFPFEYNDKIYYPPSKGSWIVDKTKLELLVKTGRISVDGSSLGYRLYFDDFPFRKYTNLWLDVGVSYHKVYAVQTTEQVVARCLLMTTDPGDLVFDPTCGSGTTAFVAEQWGRRWITCDTSRVALTLAKQRLMTAVFDYYELAHPSEGVGSGFKYKTVPHVTLKSIANNPDIREGMTRTQIDAAIARHADQETLYDQPLTDNKKHRVSGPFTVEAVPAPAVKSLEDIILPSPSGRGTKGEGADNSIARSGETLRQAEWRDELLRAGIRGKAGQHIRFARLEPLPGCRHLHADGETRPNDEGRNSVREPGPAFVPQRIVVSFGPEHAPLEQRQVAHAIDEAQKLVPKPKLIVFAAFQFDPEAAKDIDETRWPGVTLLKVQMNADLLTDDLKKKRVSNESFWLIGQPDVELASFEFLVFGEGERRIAEYDAFKKLSGLDSLAEINRLGWSDVCFYALLSQGRDVWHYLANQEGWDFHTGEYRRGTGKKFKGGIPAVSWNSPGIIGGTGDIAGDLKEFKIPDIADCRRIIERLRRNKQIIGRLEELAQTLSFPISPSTKNPKLKTKNSYRAAVHGFDYYNTKTGDVESGGAGQIAVWMLDTDYDGRSLYPRQVFFPQVGDKEGWARLAKNLKAEIDEELIEQYRGTESLPFEAGTHKRIAVKIVDDRGIESLKVMELE